MKKTELEKFFSGKKVFITGCTGFKGSWLVQILLNMGSKIYGYSLYNEENKLFDILQLENKINFVNGDVRDFNKLSSFINEVEPDVVIHLAAQPLVIDSYLDPIYTYDVNVMGTVKVCYAISKLNKKISFLNVTTDKVYENKEKVFFYKENCILNGFDPYSNSKSCSELVSSSFKKSFFNNKKIYSSTCRSGNVLGGGDFAKNRIIPDCFRAIENNKEMFLRNPESIRPYQHVLEPLFMYLNICMKQYKDKEFSSEYNIGPTKKDCCNNKKIVSYFYNFWNLEKKVEFKKTYKYHEANLLMLDNKKITKIFSWKPTFSIEDCIKKTVEWYKSFLENKNMIDVTNSQIKDFIEKNKWIK